MNGCFIETTTMEVIKWFCLVLLSGLSTLSSIRVYGQLDSLAGFISIDCGLSEKSGYVDDITTIPYTPDEQFIDTGVNYNILAAYITPTLSKSYLNVRSFTTGARNCYTLNSLLAGEKYLVRATFMYGNYDGMNKLPIFDLHIGVNFWKTINVSYADSAYLAEVITVAPANYLQVCLINRGLGTPFISGLDMRPLKPILYPWVNATQSIVLYTRLNAGPIDHTIIRYPDDSHDRIWKPWSNEPYWAEISTASRVLNINNDHFEAPSAVMQTAVVPVNASKIDFFWTAANNNPILGHLAVMHFSEIQILHAGAVRQFNIMINDKLWYGYFSPEYLYSDAVYSTNPKYDYRQYIVSIVATGNSTLPPLLNALEVFTALPVPLLGTDSGDVSPIEAIKAQYQVKRNWMGDPCAPQAYAWDGLSCSYSLSSPPTITSINLSSSGLTGAITISFASLKSLQSLDLSYNNLTGTIPDALAQLPSLTLLDLRGNQLNGSIPPGLSKRSQDGTLTLRVDQCVNGNSCVPPQPKKISPIVVVVPIVVVILIVTVILIICIRRKKSGSETNPSVGVPNERDSINIENKQDSPLQFENRRFTYKELELITNNFSQVLGKGGFGTVYKGILENGTPVAVKMCSHSASQGVKEFLAEAQHLTRVHHKNLVSMIGYCRDGDHLALVYEFMSEGTLEKHLKDEANARPLNWRQRVQIAYESAQGLEYLHKSCNPPINHRDVKTNNILLNSNLEAKLADFGLSKAFNSDINTHVSTAVVGTPGYVDPEYYTTLQLSKKSDVYSFGIVLLEIITGQPAILTAPEIIHIVQWVRQRLARGNIENIVDPRMRGEYDINSVWKVAALGLECTAEPSIQRPTMTNIVMQLNECLELVNASERNHNKQYSRRDNFYPETSDSQIRTFKMEYTRQIPEGPGPAAR